MRAWLKQGRAWRRVASGALLHAPDPSSTPGSADHVIQTVMGHGMQPAAAVGRSIGLQPQAICGVPCSPAPPGASYEQQSTLPAALVSCSASQGLQPHDGASGARSGMIWGGKGPFP